MTFADKLRIIQQKKQSLLCVGLDVDPLKIPRHLRSNPSGILTFIRSIIESTHDLVCAYKPNLAFFEAMGAEGWTILRKTLAFIPRGILTIGDAKRGDIGNTAEQYARALLDDLAFDSITVSPYMGHDSVQPYVSRKGKGIFLLALTSNPGARNFQTKKLGDRPLFEAVVRTSRGWDPGGSIGYVVGATRPSQLHSVRALVPDAPILIPGVGAQGGDLKGVVLNGCTRFGDLAVINVSRSVLYASGKKDFAYAARAEASRVREEIERVRRGMKTANERRR